MPVICAPVLRITRILVFEFAAAMMFTYGTMVSYGPPAPNNFIGHIAYMSLLMFFCFVICGQLTGGHGNPIFTLTLLLTKGSDVTLMRAFLYWAAQFIGAFAGGAVGKLFVIESVWHCCYIYSATYEHE